MPDEAATAPDQPRTKVFISYSRKDKAFCARLAEGLDGRGYEPVYDRSDRPHDDPDTRLTAQDEWWKQLQAMIAASDVMVFVVTPDSSASNVCDHEIAHARSLGKRVVAILCRDIDFNIAPERLRALNVQLDFRDDASFVVALEALAAELAVDMDWHRRGARLMRLAQQWESDGRPEGHLLRAGAIDEADAWALRRPREAPEAGPLLLAFLDASREKERADRVERRRTIGRAFVKPVEHALAEGRYDAALRLAAAGVLLGEDLDMQLVPEQTPRVVFAAEAQALRCVIHAQCDLGAMASFSSDGAHVLTVAGGAKASTARLWDAASGREIAVLQGHDGMVRYAIFSPDGTRIFMASAGPMAHIWDTSGQEIAALHGLGHEVRSAVYASDGNRIVTTAYDERVAQVWDATSGRLIATLRGHDGELNSACFSPDGRRIVTASEDHTVRVWDATTGHEIVALRGHEGPASGACFSADGTRVLTASSDRTARVWDASVGREILALRGHEDGVSDASFLSDGARAVTSSGKATRIWDGISGREIFTLRHDHWVRQSISPDGTRVATASGDAIRIYDAANGREVAKLNGHTDWIETISFNHEGTKIVTSSRGRDGTVRVWDAASGREIAASSAVNTGEQANRYSADKTRVIGVNQYDRTARIYEVTDPPWEKVIAVLKSNEDRFTKAASFRTEDDFAVTEGEKQIVWDVGRTIALVGNPAEVLAASLTNGRGVKTKYERADLLMQAAPDDLYHALVARLTPEQRENVVRRSEILACPLHPNCYLAPSQRPGWRSAEVFETSEQTAAVPPQCDPRPPAPIRKGVQPIAATILIIAALGLGVGALLLLAKFGLLEVS